MEDNKGILRTEEKDIEVITRNYFMKLFESKGVGNTSHLLSGFRCTITDSMNQVLTAILKRRKFLKQLTVWGRQKGLNLMNKRMGKRGLMALKIDMSKAYDRVEWDFLQQMMAKMGFNGSWIQLIMRCINMVTYSVELDGKSGEIFMPGRGLRQGDPLSPFLFLIYSEGLSTLLKLASAEGLLRGIKASRRGPQITHLFADDFVLFGEATEEAISSRLGVKWTNNAEKYLGLPSMKSIWAAKGLLQSGLCWRVGTGWNINIEEDVWAQDDEHLLIKKIVSNPDLLKVADLIDCTNRSWKTELIKGTFSEVDAQRILQISLARLPQDDFLAWRGEPTGEYTVRSGYRLLLHGNSINNNGYNPSENRKCYKNLWKSDLPSKLKITAWRATLNYLPTLSNLRTKRLITDDVCPRCKQEVENRNHVFRDCTVSKETWNSLNFIWPVNLVDLEFMEWFTWIVSNSRMDICRSFLYTIWAIWLARNKWIH
ncbi:uncharacterized protein [Gossypium hirsutum]|uniref:Reverse transcriptase domain-containing protein n=1 Tax=Gossypium hirsutum TaxID=3635 RepID=A0A1U8PR77_GOSHI|nr:uncharacterized protein LOC107961024 [Gossypium hirsutum]